MVNDPKSEPEGPQDLSDEEIAHLSAFTWPDTHDWVPKLLAEVKRHRAQPAVSRADAVLRKLKAGHVNCGSSDCCLSLEWLETALAEPSADAAPLDALRRALFERHKDQHIPILDRCADQVCIMLRAALAAAPRDERAQGFAEGISAAVRIVEERGSQFESASYLADRFRGLASALRCLAPAASRDERSDALWILPVYLLHQCEAEMTTCEATEEQRARSIAAVESWSDARLQGDDLHAAVAQFVAQESAREALAWETLIKSSIAATARVAELEKQLAEKTEELEVMGSLELTGKGALMLNDSAMRHADEAEARVAALEKQLAAGEASLDAELATRDRYHETADDLTAAIAKHFAADFGEHSSGNDPWRRALDALNGDSRCNAERQMAEKEGRVNDLEWQHSSHESHLREQETRFDGDKDQWRKQVAADRARADKAEAELARLRALPDGLALERLNRIDAVLKEQAKEHQAEKRGKVYHRASIEKRAILPDEFLCRCVLCDFSRLPPPPSAQQIPVPAIYCSFCVKPYNATNCFIKSGCAYICDECVDMCVPLVAAYRADHPAAPAQPEGAPLAALEKK